MKLRPYQQEALEAARNSVRMGKKRPIIAAPTAFGKTVLAAQMMKNCQDSGKKGWFFCDRKILIEQTIEKFQSMGIDFGVRQSMHELSNPAAPIQIASVQTVHAMVKKHKGRIPDIDFMLVDECHTQYEIINMIMERYTAIPIIGLTATPYSKGLGDKYDNLIVTTTTQDLIDDGYLTPIKYYAGKSVNTANLSSGKEFSLSELERETDKESEVLTGDIIRNYTQWASGRLAIAFTPSILHSKTMVEKLRAHGISAEHIDCYMTDEEKGDLIEAHNNGEFMVISCSKLLSTGYDAPNVSCIIDCYPTKSITTYVQRLGRIMRLAEGKTESIYLDHANNFERFGFVEDIVPEFLHKGNNDHKERDLIKKKDKKESAPRECPECYQQMVGLRCRACGYEVVITGSLVDDGSILTEKQKKNRQTPIIEKERFYSELRFYANQKGYSPKWADHKYREKFGVWPNKITATYVTSIREETQKYIKYINIKTAKGGKWKSY